MSQQNRNDNRNDRTPRELETREQDKRMESWAPPDMLPMPLPRAGFEHRWVRTATMGIDDPVNINRSRRDGWEPVKASEYPEVMVISDTGSRFPDSIEVGGLVLCKAPSAFIEKRNAYFANMTRNAQQAVDSKLMQEEDRRMPLFKERKSKTTFGSGDA